MVPSQSATDALDAFGSRQPPGAERDNLERARQYLAAIESGAPSSTILKFFAPDVRQIEYPNQLVPSGVERDLAAIAASAEKGQRVLQRQRYEVRGAIAYGPDVALEVLWVGVLAIAIGTLAVGDEMRANFAVFLTFRDGVIAQQRNYDCFEPF